MTANRSSCIVEALGAGAVIALAAATLVAAAFVLRVGPMKPPAASSTMAAAITPMIAIFILRSLAWRTGPVPSDPIRPQPIVRGGYFASTIFFRFSRPVRYTPRIASSAVLSFASAAGCAPVSLRLNQPSQVAVLSLRPTERTVNVER